MGTIAPETGSFIARNLSSLFINENVAIAQSTDFYADDLTNPGRQIASGGKLNIKTPGAPSVITGRSLATDGSQDQSISDLLYTYTAADATDIHSVNYTRTGYNELFQLISRKSLSNSDKSRLINNYGFPAFQRMLTEIEKRCYDELLRCGHHSVETDPTKLSKVDSELDIFNASTRMDDLSLAPLGRKSFVAASIANKLKATMLSRFNQPQNSRITTKGLLGAIDNTSLFEVPRNTFVDFTPGAQYATSANVQFKSISSDGTEITLKGLDTSLAGAVKPGDKFSLSTVKEHNVNTGTDLDTQMCVTVYSKTTGENEAIDSNASGEVTFKIKDPLKFSGMHQNCASTPADGDAVVMFPKRRMNFYLAPGALNVIPYDSIGDLPGLVKNDKMVQDTNRMFPVMVCEQGNIHELDSVIRLVVCVAVFALPKYIVVQDEAI